MILDVSTATVFEPFGVEFVPPATDGKRLVEDTARR